MHCDLLSFRKYITAKRSSFELLSSATFNSPPVDEMRKYSTEGSCFTLFDIQSESIIVMVVTVQHTLPLPLYSAGQFYLTVFKCHSKNNI